MDLGRSFGVGLAVCLLAGVVTGCERGVDAAPGRTVATPTAMGTGSGESRGTPSTATAGTPGANGAASGSADVPAAARVNTAAGAEAFVRFYFDQVNLSVTQPKRDWLAGLSTATCRPCENLVVNAATLRKRDLHLLAGPYHIQALTELPASTNSERLFQMAVQQNKGVFVSSSGATVKTEPARRNIAEVLVKHREHGWQVEDFALAEGVN